MNAASSSLWACCMVCATMMSGCASPSVSLDRAPCGRLPTPFKVPLICPPAESARLQVVRQGPGCMEISREARPQGGLHVPRQHVCSPVRPR